MIALVIAAAVAGLSPRPEALLGDAGQEAYAEWLGGEAATLDRRWTGETCGEAEITSVWPVVEAPAAFSQAPGFSDIAEGPVLHERVTLTGCGRTHQVNLLAYRLKAGGWRSLGLLPGAGNADAQLQLDAWRTALPAVTSVPGCSEEDRQSTLRVGQITLSEPVDAQGGWQEQWPITVCGQERPVQVTFTRTPADGGTDFRIRPLW